MPNFPCNKKQTGNIISLLFCFVICPTLTFIISLFKAKNKNQEWTSRFKIFRNTIRDIIDENAEYYIATIGTLNLNYSKLQISPLLPNALKIKLMPK